MDITSWSKDQIDYLISLLINPRNYTITEISKKIDKTENETRYRIKTLISDSIIEKRNYIQNKTECDIDNKSFETILVINDIHVPFHDRIIMDLIFELIEDTKPDRIVINGDLVDFYELSLFDKNPQREMSLQTEIDMATELLKTIRESSPNSKIDFIEGNHEARLRKYLARHREISSLRSLRLESLLNLEKYDINCHIAEMEQRDNYILASDSLLIGHFNKATKHSAYTAKTLIDSFNVSLVQGHTHRGGLHLRRTFQGNLFGIENYCLCNCENVEYIKFPNWQQGFTMLYLPKINLMPNNISYHMVEIRGREFIFNGKRYS